MRSRGLVVAIAVVLAIAAAGAVILYTKGVKQDAVSGGALSLVLVSTQDIPANTNLNPLIDQGAFTQLQVPTDAVVDGAVTSLDELTGQTTTSPVLANEQISSARLSSGEAAPGGNLGISAGHIGVAAEVDLERGVAGAITSGDHVAIYATFSEGTAVRKATMRQLLSPAQLEKFNATLDDGTVAAGLPVVRLGVPFTVVLVPSVRVLSVENPIVGEDGKTTGNSVMSTLDLLPDDASNLVYAKEVASVWFGLLPPENEDGYPVGATFGPSFETVVGTAK
jgi:Flp pilus assembly protein CpaB